MMIDTEKVREWIKDDLKTLNIWITNAEKEARESESSYVRGMENGQICAYKTCEALYNILLDNLNVCDELNKEQMQEAEA